MPEPTNVPSPTTWEEDAIFHANRILDIPYKDPDDSASIVARQFLRLVERHSLAEQRGKEQGAAEERGRIVEILNSKRRTCESCHYGGCMCGAERQNRDFNDIISLLTTPSS